MKKRISFTSRLINIAYALSMFLLLAIVTNLTCFTYKSMVNYHDNLKVYGKGFHKMSVYHDVFVPDLEGDDYQSFRAKYKNKIAESSKEAIDTATVPLSLFIDSNREKCTDVELVNDINAWVCDQFKYNVEYQYVGLGDSINDHEAVCWQYSYLFHEMCESAGIESRIITGKVRNVNHAWNLIVVNEKCYEFDVTWNDGISGYHAFSWLSHSEMQKAHRTRVRSEHACL